MGNDVKTTLHRDLRGVSVEIQSLTGFVTLKRGGIFTLREKCRTMSGRAKNVPLAPHSSVLTRECSEMKKKVKHHHINSGGFMTRNATRVVMLLVATLLAGALPLMAGAVQNLSMGYDVSQGTYAPISGGTVQASGSTIQGFGAAVSMGFSVTWNGTTYSDAWVTGDGFIVLAESTSFLLGRTD
jgi:hypothetical protein